MADSLICPRGHQWQPDKEGPGGSDSETQVCPCCGASPLSREALAHTFVLHPGGAGQPTDTPETRAALPVPSPDSPPGYEILEELGRGGMGVVYKARQQGLDRIVALKMILRGSHASAFDLEHFEAEARAIAKLQHPHIVQIYEVGSHQGLPYFSIEFVEGGTLALRLFRQGCTPPEAASLVHTLAQTIHFAHTRGIVHRDLKPGNILLAGTITGSEGETSPFSLPGLVPKITDFGLAKQLDRLEPLTRTGVTAGTPHYMAPEQMLGKREQIGPRTDIYALGTILYECLTGKPPFRGETPMETAQLVLEEEPIAPRYRNPNIPRDLQTICLRCLEKNPNQRYSSASSLAEDLERFLRGEPIQARPVTVWERAWKWIRRRPTQVVLWLILAVGLVLVTTLWFQARQKGQQAQRNAKAEFQARVEAQAARRQASQALRQSRRLHARAVLDLAIHHADRGNVDLGLLWLVRSLELASDASRVQSPESRLQSQKSTPLGLATRDSRLATQLQDIARINLAAWRRHLVRERARLAHTDWIWAVAFAPDGLRVATGSKDRTARLWDVQTGQPLASLEHDLPVWDVCFSPDGQFLLTGSGLEPQPSPEPPVQSPEPEKHPPRALDSAGEVRLWKVAKGTLVGVPLAHQARVSSVSFGPDGESFLAVSGDRVTLWATSQVVEQDSSPQPTHTLVHPGPVSQAIFSPDGKKILTGSVLLKPRQGTGRRQVIRGEGRLWDTATGKELGKPLIHKGGVSALAFSPDGKRLATASADGVALLWDTATGRQISKPLLHLGPIWTVAFSPDGRTLATGGATIKVDRITGQMRILAGEARLWGLDSGRPLAPVLGHPGPVRSLAFSPDSRLLLTGSEDRKARFYLAATGALVAGPFHHEGTVQAVAFSPDGRLALTSSASERPHARLWELPPGPALSRRLVYPGAIRALAVRADGSLILAGGDQGAQLWNANGHPIRPPALARPSTILSVAFSPDGKTFLTGGADQSVRLWNSSTGKQAATPATSEAEVLAVGFSADGRSFGCVDREGNSRRWQPRGKQLSAFEGKHRLFGAAIAPDGNTALFACADGMALLREMDTGEVALSWSHKEAVRSVAFSPDGQVLASGSADGAVQLRSRMTGQALTQPLVHRGPVQALAFDRQGLMLLSACRRQAQLWDCRVGVPLTPPLEHGSEVLAVAQHPTQPLLLTATRNGLVYLWERPQPVPGDIPEIRRWVQALTGLELDDQGSVHRLSRDELRQLRRQIPDWQSRGK
jgi:WD40 repeat protein/tRNA A-37 threonylcarbamoyl transferase component Bud32